MSATTGTTIRRLPRWYVERLDSGRWRAFGPGLAHAMDDCGCQSFPTWADAYAYADAMARAGR